MKPAKAAGLSSVDTVACRVDSALLNVPKADSCALSVVCWLAISFCWPTPSAFVSAETIAPMLSPDPMPVEVISELPATAPDVEELVGFVEEDIAELINYWSLVLDSSIYRQLVFGLKPTLRKLKQETYQARLGSP